MLWFLFSTTSFVPQRVACLRCQGSHVYVLHSISIESCEMKRVFGGIYNSFVLYMFSSFYLQSIIGLSNLKRHLLSVAVLVVVMAVCGLDVH